MRDVARNSTMNTVMIAKTITPMIARPVPPDWKEISVKAGYD